MKNLVIVESPAKAKTLERFLGSDYKVMSSKGHIRDLKDKDMSIDLKTFTPIYVIPKDKSAIVKELKTNAAKADTVWLASDEDREGEAISWHLANALDLKPENTKRIVFHEITKPAILKAIENPRDININLVNAQQARRVLDRIVGFKLSPVLWKKVKPSLSAGRVQSVAVRLIVEREREIDKFVPEESYRVVGTFVLSDGKGKTTKLKAELGSRFKTAAEAEAFLERCKTARFEVADVSKRPLTKSPAPPFTTSTLQQEAAHKLGFSVSLTMRLAQSLYESGKITYMRTDSVNLSTLCLGASKEEIISTMGEKYHKARQYHTNTKGAQEAHEAIRPTFVNVHDIEGNKQEKRLYDLIWKRNIASQMADAEIEKTTVTINVSGEELQFVATGEVVTFDGFLRVYSETQDTAFLKEELQDTNLLQSLKPGMTLAYNEIQATERFTQHPLRYTEASLVKKLEELGIGRPSTYAPTISTIQQRGYVEKGSKPGQPRKYEVMTLKKDKISKETKEEITGTEKNKLIPTDIGMVVNDYLMVHFPEIMDYNFTANVEKDFDEIAAGKENWKEQIKSFYNEFEPKVEEVGKRPAAGDESEGRPGERFLGNDPASGRPVYSKIGKYGPIVQIGVSNSDNSEEEAPMFAQVPKDMSIYTISLEDALELFKYHRWLGKYNDDDVVMGRSMYGPYVKYGKEYVSIPKEVNPLTLTLDDAIGLIEEKKRADAAKVLKTFDEDPDMQIRNGRYGPYVACKGKNYRIAKTTANPAELTYEQCLEIIKAQGEKPSRSARTSRATSKRSTAKSKKQ